MEERVLIIDFNHIAHTYAHSQVRLSSQVVQAGITKVVDTTIPNFSIKLINKWSRGGMYPTVVCFDSPVISRKMYFANAFNMSADTADAYKAGRSHMESMFYTSIELTKNLLARAGVKCLQANNYEADDLIFACIVKAKQDYPNAAIDVVTNDADLLPLVDDKVSVFIRSRVNTYAVRPELEKAHYIQVVPENYSRVVEDMSAYRNFRIPYNSILLHKLLRGDTSDNIPGVKKKYPPKKYSAMIEAMLADGVDFENTFRYGICPKTYYNTFTGQVITREEALANQGNSKVVYQTPVELANILAVLDKYTNGDRETLEHVEKAYLGFNLNQAYVGLGSSSRHSAVIRDTIPRYNEINLIKVAAELSIRVPAAK
jgi:DNA polymerase-1